jgi:diguanylate cyclase (GGDEF)-like protein
MGKNLRTYLIVGLFALQAVAVLAIIVLTGATTNRLLVKQMDQQMSTAAQSAVYKTEGLLEGADDAASIAKRVVESELADPAEVSHLERFLASELDVNELLAGAYWAAPDHSFVIVQRDATHGDAQGYHTKIIRDLEGHRVVTNVYRDHDFNEVERAVDPDDTYDPVARPWYQAAEKTDGQQVVWTAPYIFFTSKQPGVTAAVRVNEDDDVGSPMLGVVGVDIELQGLSKLLAEEVNVSPHGLAVITDSKGIVIATRDAERSVKQGPNGLERTGVDEIGSPAMVEAFRVGAPQLASTTPDHPTSVAFTAEGEGHRAVFSALEGHPDWYVTVIAPEQDYVGDIQRTQRINGVLAVAVGLGIVCVALPVVRLLARRSERLVQRATTDALTGLANRRHFEEVLEREIARATDRRRPLVVAMLDLDHFKSINDTYGHGVGDQALIAVARRLTDAVRGDDLVARLGGDEYAVMICGLDLDAATAALERARVAIEATPIRADAAAPEPVTAGSTDGTRAADAEASQPPLVPVRVTIGVADLIPGVRDNAALLRRADQALYVAKKRGRNQVATIRDVDPRDAGVTLPSAPVPEGVGAVPPGTER